MEIIQKDGDSNSLQQRMFLNRLASVLVVSFAVGRNARISNNGLTAARPNALGEFNDAILMSNRPLRDDEVFEIVIERTVDRWSGSIEAGVTLIRPEDLEFPNTVKYINQVFDQLQQKSCFWTQVACLAEI